MCKSRFVVLMAAVGGLCWSSFAHADDAAWVRVEPKETDEILANPGMGWETFHRTADDDKNLPSWIPSTIHYARWGWKVLEPEKGKIPYDFLDGVLKERRGSLSGTTNSMVTSSTNRNGSIARMVSAKAVGGAARQSALPGATLPSPPSWTGASLLMAALLRRVSSSMPSAIMWPV